jgi:two-component system nitrogen regulation response regulator NtrX
MSRSKPRAGWPPAIVGGSPVARRLRVEFLRATRPSTRVLIVAPPGMDAAGIARAIHGADAAAPLVEVDCSDADPATVERRLLGRASKAGSRALEHVDATAALLASRHGTCVVHGIEELSHRAQARLARVLRDGEVRARTGGRVPVRCRIIAVGSPALARDEPDEHLRADLHRRLGAIRLELPPLSARREDIEQILLELMAQSAARRHVSPRPFTDAALALVCALQWPDNVSGLSSLVDWLVARSDEPVRVEEVLAYLGGSTQPSLAPHASLREARRQFERDYITAVLRRFDGRVAAAAQVLGIQRTNLYRKARQLGIHGGGRG